MMPNVQDIVLKIRYLEQRDASEVLAPKPALIAANDVPSHLALTLLQKLQS
jgi:hypothetical protein